VLQLQKEIQVNQQFEALFNDINLKSFPKKSAFCVLVGCSQPDHAHTQFLKMLDIFLF
jgi:hypothetical protein